MTAGLTDEVLAYWQRRTAQHLEDTYVGVRLSKFPEDLRVYEHLLWASAATVVVEIGAQFGGSALWFRDRLATFARYRPGSPPVVISIDLEVEVARENLDRADPTWSDGIVLIEGDVLDPTLPSRVAEHVPEGARCLVSEDSAHVFDTTLAALKGFSRFVPSGGYFVVEDGCVDIEELRLSDDWPRGVLPAIEAFTGSSDGSAFRVRRDLELYGVSCHPGGYLQRAEASAP